MCFNTLPTDSPFTKRFIEKHFWEDAKHESANLSPTTFRKNLTEKSERKLTESRVISILKTCQTKPSIAFKKSASPIVSYWIIRRFIMVENHGKLEAQKLDLHNTDHTTFLNRKYILYENKGVHQQISIGRI